MLVHVPATPLLIQIPTPWKTAKDDPSTWTPEYHVEDPGEVPGTWLWPGPVEAIVAMWVVNQSSLTSLCLSNKSLKKYGILCKSGLHL